LELSQTFKTPSSNDDNKASAREEIKATLVAKHTQRNSQHGLSSKASASEETDTTSAAKQLSEK